MRKCCFTFCTCILQVIVYAQFPTELTQLKPNTRWGGLVNSVSINPTNANVILIGTGAGGLYRSNDGGNTWAWIENFPTTAINIVSFCPTDPNIILVTANYDTRTERSGGVYRSNDGGLSWSRPAGTIPPVTSRCPDRCSAAGISWLPGTRIVWIATDCGLIKSTDLGETWTNIIVDPAAAGDYDIWDTRFRPSRMFSVIAIDENRVIAGGESGYYYMHDGSTWNRSRGAACRFLPMLTHHSCAS